MPKVKVESQSKFSPNEAYQKIRKLLENDRDLRKMDPSYACDFNDSAMTGTAKGSKFEAAMRVMSSGAGSTVEIEIHLPLMLSPFKGVVQSTLQKKLDASLA